MSIFEGYEPKSVFEYFERICSIPRPSGSEKEISNFLVNFANEHNLEVYQDDAYNVIIKKKAYKGYENRETIVLQAHMDMVSVMNEDAPADINTSGVSAYVDGDFIRAKRSTLSADDGIGIAFILAILADSFIEHPAIEAIFTSSEEVGLDGAKSVDISKISGRKLINIDTEEENHLVVGCAGGCRSDITFNYKQKAIEGIPVLISIDGLTGGHSGTEIDKGLANANYLLGRLLCELKDVADFRLFSFEGGENVNAICSEAKSVIIIRRKYLKTIKMFIKNFEKEMAISYKQTDPNFAIHIKKADKATCKVMGKKDFARLMVLLNIPTQGVIRMSQVHTGTVETSENLGVVCVRDGQVSVCYSLRSNLDSAREWIKKRLTMVAKCIDANIDFRGEYPAWESAKVGELAGLAADKYRNLFGEDIEIITIHAGLECALFYEKMPDMEAISIGPDIMGAHTTNESVSIESIEHEWKLLLEILKG